MVKKTKEVIEETSVDTVAVTEVTEAMIEATMIEAMIEAEEAMTLKLKNIWVKNMVTMK